MYVNFMSNTVLLRSVYLAIKGFSLIKMDSVFHHAKYWTKDLLYASQNAYRNAWSAVLMKLAHLALPTESLQIVSVLANQDSSIFVWTMLYHGNLRPAHIIHSDQSTRLM
jgi:hypothetical protein